MIWLYIPVGIDTNWQGPQNMYIRRVQWSQWTFCCLEKRTSGTLWDNQIEHQFIVWNIDMTHSKRTVWTWKFWPNANNSPSWTVKPPGPARLWWQKQVFVSLRRSWIQTKYTAKFGRTLHCIMPIPLGGFQIFGRVHRCTCQLMSL